MSLKHKAPPSSHPHVAVVTFDPIMWRDLQRHIDDHDELKFFGVDQSEPDIWTAHVGCASKAVRELMQQWGC
jgi:hypothetical protein